MCAHGKPGVASGLISARWWSDREWGRIGLKAIFCFLTANRIKLTFGRGVDGASLTANCPESLVFSSPVYTSVTEKSIWDFSCYLLYFCKLKKFQSMPCFYWSRSSFSCGPLEFFVSSSGRRTAEGYLIDGGKILLVMILGSVEARLKSGMLQGLDPKSWYWLVPHKCDITIWHPCKFCFFVKYRTCEK